MSLVTPFKALRPATGRAAEARAYLDRRGLTAATRERFEIGHAPDGRTALLDHLVLTDLALAGAHLGDGCG